MRTAWDAIRSVQRYLALALGPEWEVTAHDDPAGVHFPYCAVRRISAALFSPTTRTLDSTLPLVVVCYAGPKETVAEASAAAYAIEEVLTRAITRGAAPLEPPAGLVATPGATGSLAAGAHAYQVTALGRSGETTPCPVATATLAAPGSAVLTWNTLPGAAAFAVYRDGLLAQTVLSHSWTDSGLPTNASQLVPTANTSVLGHPRRIPLYDFDSVGVDEAVHDAVNRPMASDYMRVTDFSVQQIPEPENPRMIAVSANIRVTWVRTGALPSGTQTAESVRIGFTTG